MRRPRHKPFQEAAKQNECRWNTHAVRENEDKAGELHPPVAVAGTIHREIRPQKTVKRGVMGEYLPCARPARATFMMTFPD